MATGPVDLPPPYRTVIFDCDSTLASIEGIEELAEGHGPELARLTAQAMDGSLPLEAVYGKRLEIVRPTRSQAEEVGRRYVETLLPHGKELCAALRALEKRVAIVSGGLQLPVAILGRHLGLIEGDVHAVGVEWDAEGAYAGFDTRSPLARSGGKPEVLGQLGQEPGARPMVLVGDGATDLEAAPLCGRFVAFGGVERRERVFAGARAHCEAPDLAALVPLLLSPEEIERLREDPRHARLLEAAGPFL